MRWVLLLLVWTVVGCGTVSARDPDASLDKCEVYCSCVTSACGDEVLSCASECRGLTEPQLDCRTLHCGFAQEAADNDNASGVELHCGHAHGIGNCE